MPPCRATPLQALLELGHMTPTHCATLAWAFATSAHYVAPLLDALLLRAADMAPAAGPQDVADLLWASAHVGHGLGAAGELLVGRAGELACAMSARQLVDTFWALAVLGLLDSNRFADMSRLLAAMPGAPPPQHPTPGAPCDSAAAPLPPAG
jgi:hypothetical protein